MASCPTTTRWRDPRGGDSAPPTSSPSWRSTSSTTDPGAKGALLRREGLYSSHIVEWRRAREVGALAELAPKVRRSKRNAEQAEIERLRRRNERLEDQLAKHKQALEIQGKASELLTRLLAEGTEETIQRPERPRRDRGLLLEDRAAARHCGGVRGRGTASGHALPRRLRPGRVTPPRPRPSATEQARRRGGRGHPGAAAL